MKNLLFVIVLAALFAACGKSEKTFDKELREANIVMLKTFFSSTLMCDRVAEVWHNAIYDNETPSGKYCSDFNTALNELFSSKEFSAICDSINKWNDDMLKLASTLNDHPESRKDCYNDFIDIVGEVSSCSRMATNPTGSLKSYGEQKNEMYQNVSRKLDQFKIKYGSFLEVK